MTKPFMIQPVLTSTKIHISNAVKCILCKQDIYHALNRHFSCDWGNVNDLEWLKNDRAFKSGNKVRSRYISRNGIPFEIISEPENKDTRILLSARYERKGA